VGGVFSQCGWGGLYPLGRVYKYHCIRAIVCYIPTTAAGRVNVLHISAGVLQVYCDKELPPVSKPN